MVKMRNLFLAVLSMLAFASNSILCRLALKNTSLDPASFTSIRLVSGSLMLGLLVSLRKGSRTGNGNWRSAFALFIYAAGFSFAYISLPTASGALLLFGAVQITMIGYGIWSGEKLGLYQITGFLLASAGLVGLLLPGLSAPPVVSSLLMLGAGAAWGIYSLRGKVPGDPIQATAGNFWRAAILAVLMSLLLFGSASFDKAGVWYAITSGALTSGIGYVIWYTALPGLRATQAAILQLSVPVLAAAGGIVFLGESPSLRLIFASAAILGGIALVIKEKSSTRRSEKSG